MRLSARVLYQTSLLLFSGMSCLIFAANPVSADSIRSGNFLAESPLESSEMLGIYAPSSSDVGEPKETSTMTGS